MRNRDFELWVQDVEYWVRIKTRNPQYFIEDSQDDYPLDRMFNDDWSAGDAADDIINGARWD